MHAHLHKHAHNRMRTTPCAHMCCMHEYSRENDKNSVTYISKACGDRNLGISVDMILQVNESNVHTENFAQNVSPLSSRVHSHQSCPPMSVFVCFMMTLCSRLSLLPLPQTSCLSSSINTRETKTWTDTSTSPCLRAMTEEMCASKALSTQLCLSELITSHDRCRIYYSTDMWTSEIKTAT